MQIPSRIDLNALLVFAAVAETGGFTAAADRLGIAKARVSLDIGRLEARLGTSLFKRTTRKVQFTDAGTELYEQAIPPLRGIVDALGRVADGGGEIAGALRIACTPEYAVQSVARAVAAFAELHPRLRIDLRSSDKVVDLIDEGIDLSFRAGWLRDSSLRAVRIATFEQHVIAGPGYLRRAGTPKDPDDLAAHAWIALTLLPAPLTWQFTAADGAERTVRLKARFSADSPAAVRALVEADAGISICDAPGAREAVQAGRVKRLLPKWRLPEGGIYAVFPPGRHVPPGVRAFIDFYRGFIGKS